MAVKGGYLVIAGGGAILLWSGLKGKSWSQVLRAVIAGKKPETTLTAYPITGTNVSGSGTGGISLPNIPGGGTTAKNMVIGKTLAAAFGWATGAQWDSLIKLWNQESGWNNHAENPSSHAYGIPQALPASKMGPLANPPISSASAQIGWGLIYIKSRYGSPVNAWAHEQANDWY